MSKNVIQMILGGVLGLVLAINGLSILTPGFWIIIGLALAMRFVGDE
jgi:hypothetical protein